MSEPNPYGTEGRQWGPQGSQPPNSGPGYGYPAGAPQGGQVPNSAPGYGYPGGAAPQWGPPQNQPVMGGGVPVLSLGDITVVNGSIMTPAGALPLKGAVWNATDMSRTEEKMPTVAIVLAVIFFIFCLLGLLFLLMKEKKTTGFVQVTVNSGGRHHSTMIPATDAGTFQWVMGQINYARSLSM
ncbi:hypothetical protein ABZX93_20985 [Streptomyces sp. NPDC006632]|uniref:hypothetical protein n=1 Tax=unclassified Streptomyces TaxID=2593676 RepID=UPI002E1AF9B2